MQDYHVIEQVSFKKQRFSVGFESNLTVRDVSSTDGQNSLLSESWDEPFDRGGADILRNFL